MKKYLNCDAKDGNGKKIQCTELGELLSWNDQKHFSAKGESQTDRTLRYRCPDGHRFDVVLKDIQIIPDEPQEEVLSKKRFHKKGFTGHQVRKNFHMLRRNPAQSNHQSMLERKLARSAA